MNIDFLITSLGGGGAERVLCNLANYLANRGVNVSITAIFCPKNIRTDSDSNIWIITPKATIKPLFIALLIIFPPSFYGNIISYL